MEQKRLRVYNSAGYYSFSTKNHLKHDQTMTVCAYLTKKKKNKTYYSGRLIIPSRFCESSKLIKENYGLF